jgi:hypothetical protein
MKYLALQFYYCFTGLRRAGWSKGLYDLFLLLFHPPEAGWCFVLQLIAFCYCCSTRLRRAGWSKSLCDLFLLLFHPPEAGLDCR